MDHSCTTRSRSPLFATVRFASPTSRNRPSVFAFVRLGRLCKQGVVGSSPIVSTKFATRLIRHFVDCLNRETSAERR